MKVGRTLVGYFFQIRMVTSVYNNINGAKT